MTQVRILSDLHFGHPGCRIDSVEQIRPLLEGVSKKVIINGDVCEQRHSKFEKIGAAHIADLLALGEELEIELVFLRGNHDPYISDQDYLKLGSRGQIFVTHGDAFFKDISPWSNRAERCRDEWHAIWEEMLPAVETDLDTRCAYTDRARQFGARYRDEFKTGRLRVIRAMLKLAWPPRRPYKVLETWFRASHIASRFADQYFPEAETIIFGHTHFSGEWKNVRGRQVINTGGFVSMGSARAVDLIDDEVVVRRIEREDNGAYQFR